MKQRFKLHLFRPSGPKREREREKMKAERRNENSSCGEGKGGRKEGRIDESSNYKGKFIYKASFISVRTKKQKRAVVMKWKRKRKILLPKPPCFRRRDCNFFSRLSCQEQREQFLLFFWWHHLPIGI